jgi:hypothetical protein
MKFLFYVLCEGIVSWRAKLEGRRRKYLQKQGGVRDMRPNEIGDTHVAYLFVLRLGDG